jgi:hypothetical protein
MDDCFRKNYLIFYAAHGVLQYWLPAYSPVHWHLCRGLPIGTTSFSTVPEAMLTLLIHGVFLGEVDSTKSVSTIISQKTCQNHQAGTHVFSQF